MSSSVLFGVATGPDLLRLLAVPVFAWAAYRDLRTRRVPNWTWYPLVAVGLIALLWDLLTLGALPGFQRRLFVVQTVLSLGFVAPLGYLFWRIGGFGGADAKAIITLAVLFPVYPTYYALGGAYPVYDAPLGVFSFTILSNTVLVGLLYPVALAVRNLPRGTFTPAMFVGHPVSLGDVPTAYGRLLEASTGFTRGGLDIDALRMYLRWRGISFSALRADPQRYRGTVPVDPNDPGDGSLGDGTIDDDGPVESITDDPWGAEAFLAEHSAYGTTPEELRDGLSTLAEPDRESIWITPGIPFIVPMLAGLAVALAFGDVMFAALSAVGLWCETRDPEGRYGSGAASGSSSASGSSGSRSSSAVMTPSRYTDRSDPYWVSAIVAYSLVPSNASIRSSVRSAVSTTQRFRVASSTTEMDSGRSETFTSPSSVSYVRGFPTTVTYAGVSVSRSTDVASGWYCPA